MILSKFNLNIISKKFKIFTSKVNWFLYKFVLSYSVAKLYNDYNKI